MIERVEAEDNIDGRFVDNNLATGTRGTRIEAREQNAVFFEVANVVREAGIDFDAISEVQLAQSIITIAKRENAPALLALKKELEEQEELNSTQNNRLDNVESINTTQNNRLSAVEGINSQQDNSLSSLQERIVELEARPSNAELEVRLHQLEQRTFEELMPIGYIYVQYPGQPAPQSLYPKSTWSDISASFAGNFFRVAGGLASNFNSGSQLESVPNITGNSLNVGSHTQSGGNSGALQLYRGNRLGYIQKGSSDNEYYPRTLYLDAYWSNGAYGRRDEVSPQNQTMRIWRKTGTVVATKSVAVLDEHHLFVKVVELEEDEAGLIGFNPCVHVELPSPTMLHAQASQKTTYEEAHVLWYDIKHNVWQCVRDDRGRMIWHADGSSRKNWEVVAKLGAEETFEAPVLEESQLDELDDEQ